MLYNWVLDFEDPCLHEPPILELWSLIQFIKAMVKKNDIIRQAVEPKYGFIYI